MKLQAYLQRTGTSVAWLARCAGLSRPHMSMMLSGRRPMTVETRHVILNVLRTRAALSVTPELFEEED